MCKYQEYNEFNQEICTLTGTLCEGACDLEEPSEYDVINGYFDDDPEGYKRWRWENYGCPKCKQKLLTIEDLDYCTLYKCLLCGYKEEIV